MRSSDTASAVSRQIQLAPASAAPRRGSEYAELSRQVKEAGLLERRPGYYTWKIAVTIGLLAAGWTAFVVVGNSWWQIAVAAFLAVIFTQIGFLGHDAGHRQIFGTRRASYVAGVLLGNLGIGLSYGWWTGKHNRHHAHPNTEDADPDIAVGAFAFTAGAGARQPRPRPPGVPLPGVPVLPAAAAGSGQPACRERPGADPPGGPPPVLGEGADYRARGRLPDRGVPGALARQGRGVHHRAAGPVRPVPGVLLRPQPQGHAHPGRRRSQRFPAPPGAHLPQCARRPADRLRPRRPELPDRAPPVPLHAPAQPAPLPGPDRGVLPAARRAVLPEQPGRLLRPGPAPPQCRRQAGPPRRRDLRRQPGLKRSRAAKLR